MTKSVLWSSCFRLSCTGQQIPSVILCLKDSALLAAQDCPYPYTTLEATLINNWKDCAPGCTQPSYRYLFSYDETLLADPATPLTTADISGVFCEGCLTSWVKDEVGNEVTVVTNDDGSQTLISQHGCEYNLAGGGSPQVPLIVTDTSTIDLTINGTIPQTLFGAVKVSADAGNQIAVHSDGLFVPASGGGSGWALLGNAGTVDGTNFCGTTDNVPFTVRANNLQTFRFEPDPLGVRIIGGCEVNQVDPYPGNTILSGGNPTNGPLGNGTNYIQGGGDPYGNSSLSGYCLIVGGLSCEMFPAATAPSNNIFGYNYGHETIVGGWGCFIQNDNEESGFNTWSPFGSNFIGGGDTSFIIDAQNCVIGGGSVCFIDYSSSSIPPKPVVTFQAGYDSICGGSSCYILAYDEGSSPGTAPEQLGYNSIIGGNECAIEEGYGCVVSGGVSNLITSRLGGYNLIASRANLPQLANAVLGGYQNYIVGTARSIIGGGGLNTLAYSESCSILSGYLNSIINTAPVTLPDISAFPNCKTIDPVNGIGVGNILLGGINNQIKDGRESTHLGGAFLKIGAYTLGYQNAHTRDFTNINGGNTRNVCSPHVIPGEPFQVDVSAFSDLFYLGDVDLWIANTDSTARKLKLFEPNSDTTFATTNYTSFRAQAQAANLDYILPAAAGVAGQKLGISGVSGTDITLDWENTYSFQSADFTHVSNNAGTTYTFTHNFGAKPSYVELFLKGYKADNSADANSVCHVDGYSLVGGTNAGYRWSSTDNVLTLVIFDILLGALSPSSNTLYVRAAR